jgi:hypothetical protein
MPDSRYSRSNCDRGHSDKLIDTFGRTSDFLAALDPATGLTLKGVELAWRILDKHIAEESRQRRG